MRRTYATFILIAIAGLSIWLVRDSQIPFWIAGPVQVAFYAIALVTSGRLLFARPHGALLFVLLAALLLFPFGVLLRTYGFVDLIAFTFHFQAGITLESMSDSFRPMIVVAGALVFFTLAIYHLGSLWNRMRDIAVAGAAVILVMNPVVGGAYSALTIGLDPLGLAGRITPPALAGVATPPTTNPDLIVIYLEGTEQGYADRNLFGDIYDPLRSLWPEAAVLSNIAQITATNWSIAGMSATQCGLPLLPDGIIAHNLFHLKTEFLDGHICLGDVLNIRGYHSEFIVGGEAFFAGITHFYNTHQFDEQIDLADFVDSFSAEEYTAAFSEWVVDDQMVFDMARQRYRQNQQREGAFALVVETFGPHGPMHLLSRRCTRNGVATLVNDMRPAVRCLADEVLEFVRFVQAESAGRETVFLILSDHLGHDPALRRMMQADERRNTAMIIGPTRAGTVIDSPGSMIDIYPTLLDYLGLIPPGGRAGLGVSLLGDTPSLVEELGITALNDQLRYDPAIRDAIWRN